MQDADSRTRRRFLATVGTGVGASLAGCSGILDSGDEQSGAVTVPELSSFRGSGTLASGRPAPGGTSIEELPNLSGELNVYVGGGEGGIYEDFVEKLEAIYPDFDAYLDRASSSSLAQTIVQEVDAGATEADVFWSIDASSLGYVADNDAYEPLPDDVVSPVPESFQGSDNAWVGVAGRARSVPYNTDELSASDVPDSVRAFPETAAFQDDFGWAPTYGAFKSFVTAMRLLRGPDATRQWLVDMREAGAMKYPDEFVVSGRVADGALTAGFANHYYALRVKNRRTNPPIDLAFTSGDAGALVNVAGTMQVKGTDKPDLAQNFVRHLLSAEAQEFFATVSFAYPMIPEVKPVGGLPTIEELNPPDIDLSELSNLEPTLTLMREAGVLG